MRIPVSYLVEKGAALDREIRRVERLEGNVTQVDLYGIAELAHAIHMEASKWAETEMTHAQ